MSEQVIEKYGINFEERAKQILSTEPILAAKDLEVQFTLRGEKLNAMNGPVLFLLPMRIAGVILLEERMITPCASSSR